MYRARAICHWRITIFDEICSPCLATKYGEFCARSPPGNRRLPGSVIASHRRGSSEAQGDLHLELHRRGNREKSSVRQINVCVRICLRFPFRAPTPLKLERPGACVGLDHQHASISPTGPVFPQWHAIVITATATTWFGACLTWLELLIRDLLRSRRKARGRGTPVSPWSAARIELPCRLLLQTPVERLQVPPFLDRLGHRCGILWRYVG